MDEIFDTLTFDPNYQQNLFLIDSALQEVGALPGPAIDVMSDIFDEQLRTLIEAVPLE